MDKMIIKKDVIVSKNNDNSVIKKYHFNNKNELCYLIFKFFNTANYRKIYFNKKIEATEENAFGVQEMDIFINIYGQDTLKVLVDTEYISLVRSFIYEFGYTKRRDDKKLMLK